MTVVLGLVYPLVVTGIGQVAFPNAADGSTVEVDGKVVGSKLIGQDFEGDRRTSRAARPSRGTPRRDVLQQPRARTRRRWPCSSGASSSTTSRASGRYVPGLRRGRARRRGHDVGLGRRPAHLARERAHPGRRVAEVRGSRSRRVRALIDQHTDGRFAGVLGEPGVNVLELNIALDAETRR